jgi:hypothetical protein
LKFGQDKTQAQRQIIITKLVKSIDDICKGVW